jgi:hypothetical protein
MIVGCFDHMTGTKEVFSTVQTEIAAGRPLGVRIGWNPTGGHFLAIAGWQTTASGAEFYEVHDPIWGVQTVSRSQFETAYRGSGTWTHSYFVTMAPSGGAVAFVAHLQYPDAIGA